MKHPNDIVETYFKCTHCYYHYTAYVKNKRVDKLHKKLGKMLRDEEGNYLDKEKAEQTREEVANVMNRLKDNLINYGKADL